MAQLVLQEPRTTCPFLDVEVADSSKFDGLTLFDKLPFRSGLYSGFVTYYRGKKYAFACGDQFGRDVFIGVSVIVLPINSFADNTCLLLHFLPRNNPPGMIELSCICKMAELNYIFIFRYRKLV